MHLLYMLRNAAMVDATMRGVVDPDAPMIGGAVGLLRSSRRFLSLLLMFLALGLFVFLALRIPGSHGSGEKNRTAALIASFVVMCITS
jgi:hypothetical protein